MAITVDYGKCDKCGDTNVKTAQVCRSCTSALPWARPKQAAPASAPQSSFTSAPINTSSSSGFSAGFYVQILGGLIFVAGCCLWLGNMTRLMPTFPGLGYITAVIGGTIWGSGAAMDNHGADD